MIRRSQQVPSNSEEILDDSVDGQESLGMAGRFESAHLPLSLAGRLMRDFGAIVGVASSVMINGRQEGSKRGSIAFAFVGDDSKRFFPLAAHQSLKEPLGGALIPARLNQDVDHVTVWIHGPPEILLLAVDSDEDLIQVPAVAEAALAALQLSSIVRTELLTPMSNGFIGNDEAAFCEKIFHISKAQAETMINPAGMANDFDREAVTVVTRTTGFHALSLAASSSS